MASKKQYITGTELVWDKVEENPTSFLKRVDRNNDGSYDIVLIDDTVRTVSLEESDVKRFEEIIESLATVENSTAENESSESSSVDVSTGENIYNLDELVSTDPSYMLGRFIPSDLSTCFTRGWVYADHDDVEGGAAFEHINPGVASVPGLEGKFVVNNHVILKIKIDRYEANKRKERQDNDFQLEGVLPSKRS
jgi:hypothetical protein